MDKFTDVKVLKDTYEINGPKDLIEKLTSIVGFEPDNESIVIVNTDLSNDYVISCKVISTLDLFDFWEHVDDIDDDKVGTILCYYTKQKLDHIRPSAERLFDQLNDSINVRDFLYIRKNRWGSFICFDDKCCPPKGKVIE
jgi:hypothetical protein